ncbi:MAG: hypothetical protein R3174_13685 [Gammaproteobacteria bacterium]|nr:hypothetical protein [Gammaproteobacteria bacterium]
MKKLSVITIHGMGVTPRGYADEFGRLLSKQVGRDTWDNEIHFAQIYYQDELQANQDRVWRHTRPKVDWKKLRRFLLFGFSDAASLESNKYESNSKYTGVQQIILDTFREAFSEMGERAGPVVFVGHSLGCQVISNYLWDSTRRSGASVGVWQEQPGGIERGSPLDRVARGKTIRRLYTSGCNIPIFVAGHDTIKPIPRLNKTFQWHNYYDEDDVLGWPLKPLSDGYRKLVNDHEINAGGHWYETPFMGWHPLSHTTYWRDSDFVSPVAAFVRSQLG